MGLDHGRILHHGRVDDAVRQLMRRHRRPSLTITDSRGLGDEGGRPVERTPRAYLAGVDQVDDRANQAHHRHTRRWPLGVDEIDGVDADPAQ